MKMQNTTSNGGLLPPTYATKIEIAAMLQLTPRTIDLWMKKRRIPYLKIGRCVRFDIADVKAYLASKCRIDGQLQ